jgi:hypothetical protein
VTTVVSSLGAVTYSIVALSGAAAIGSLLLSLRVLVRERRERNEAVSFVDKAERELQKSLGTPETRAHAAVVQLAQVHLHALIARPDARSSTLKVLMREDVHALFAVDDRQALLKEVFEVVDAVAAADVKRREATPGVLRWIRNRFGGGADAAAADEVPYGSTPAPYG